MSKVIGYDIIKYCAEEVDRQRAEPLAVLWMIDAWWHAMGVCTAGFEGTMTLSAIEELGSIVDPIRNANGFRLCGVRVGDRICPDNRDVPRLLSALLDSPLVTEPSAFYYQFELIHPFVDGNGRTGKILFNWLNRTLTNPVMPPNFFGCANP